MLFRLKKDKLTVCLLLEGSANGIGAGICVARAYIDLLSLTGVCTVMVNAIGNITGNTHVLRAGLASLFVTVVCVHGFKYPFNLKNIFERMSSFVI